MRLGVLVSAAGVLGGGSNHDQIRVAELDADAVVQLHACRVLDYLLVASDTHRMLLSDGGRT